MMVTVETPVQRFGLGTLLRTVRHVKLRQVVGRLSFKLRAPSPDLRQAPPLRAHAGMWVRPAMREPSLLGTTCLRLLNETRDVGDCGWDDPSADKLWRYNLHYFDDLNARDSAARTDAQRALVAQWIEENPPGSGTGWEPYPTSLRIVNMIKWIRSGITPETSWLHSLATQARWLEKRLEFHLMGNHLFANAKALVFAGAFFEGPEAQRWLRIGSNIVAKELDEQVLDDGGQFELSPMYHALALEDVLDLCNLLATIPSVAGVTGSLPMKLRSRAPHMLYWLRCMSHPDGRIAHFNDAADGIAPSLAELEGYAAQLGIRSEAPPPEGITHLRYSGYVRVARADMVALLDVAAIGPSYLPGHAHADTLSFEVSLGGRRVIVNGGTSCYGTGPQRLFERSTAAHSTVQVGGIDSSEVWSGFRVGRRARATPPALDGWEVFCSHDGYRFLPGAPRHYRRWSFGACEMAVEDTLRPAGQPALARYILAPGLRLQPIGHSRWRVLADRQALMIVEVTQGSASVEPTTHAPQFGKLLQVESLVVELRDGRAVTRWSRES